MRNARRNPAEGNGSAGYVLRDGNRRQTPWGFYLEGSVVRLRQLGAWTSQGAGAGLRGPGLNPDGSWHRALSSTRGTPKVDAQSFEVGGSTSRGASAEPQGRMPDLPGSTFRVAKSKAGPDEVQADSAIPMCRTSVSNRSIASVKSRACISAR